VSATPDIRSSLRRARWAVVQTGIITSALAAFGVYVLSSRINEIELMQWYAGKIPAGAMFVGAAAASGYVIGAWWTGARVRGWLLAGILGVHLLAFLGAHYAEFTTHPLYWRETEKPVGFFHYLHYMSIELAYDGKTLPPIWYAYFMRAIEFAAFSLVVLVLPLVLIWRPRCPACRCTVIAQPLGYVATPDDLRIIKQMAAAKNLVLLRKLISQAPAQIGVTLYRCPVCNLLHIVPANGNEPIVLSTEVANELIPRTKT
jgi:hypothetical protein